MAVTLQRVCGPVVAVMSAWRNFIELVLTAYDEYVAQNSPSDSPYEVPKYEYAKSYIRSMVADFPTETFQSQFPVLESEIFGRHCQRLRVALRILPNILTTVLAEPAAPLRAFSNIKAVKIIASGRKTVHY